MTLFYFPFFGQLSGDYHFVGLGHARVPLPPRFFAPLAVSHYASLDYAMRRFFFKIAQLSGHRLSDLIITDTVKLLYSFELFPQHQSRR